MTDETASDVSDVSYADIGFKGLRDRARDTLGHVYESFLGKFAAAEGSCGGEFHTPRSVTGVLIQMLETYAGRAYDPACDTGSMFVEPNQFVEAIHGIEANKRMGSR